MAKKLAVQSSQPVEVAHVLANEIGETLAIVRPFVVWPLLAIGAALLHHFWARSFYVVAFLVVSAILIPVLVWHASQHLKIPAFIHIVITSVVIATTLGMVDVLGWSKASLFAVLMVLPMICLTWSIRSGISAREEATGQHLGSYFDQAGLPDTHMKLAKTQKTKRKKRKWWDNRDDADETEELLPPGKQRHATEGRRVKGTIHHPPGEITEDVVKNLRRVESAAGFPPGTLTVTPNTDHAGVSDAVLSDPRVISNAIPYPGPSYVGGSIADTISVALYQDGTEVEFDIPGLQIQIMGQTGSGKSLGAGWSTLAEIITRYDAIVWGIDVTKGMQTLGPLAPAIHRLATDEESAISLLSDVQQMIKPRTNYLAEKGLSKWQKDCGLKYLVVWLEEVPDIMSGIGKAGKDTWIRSVKAARSAGITFVWSLQRSDFRELPTITRSQGGKWCFGLADEKDAKLGLTTAQIAANCEPQLWGNRKPGMSFLDVPGIDESKIPMPLRTWYWGSDDALIKAHALQYPISERPYDDIMLGVMSASSEAPDDKTAVNSKRQIKIPEVKPEKEKMSTDQARTHVRAWLLAAVKDDPQRVIVATDIPEMIKETGFGRAWGYKVMRELTAEGFLKQGTSDGFSYQWTINP